MKTNLSKTVLESVLTLGQGRVEDIAILATKFLQEATVMSHDQDGSKTVCIYGAIGIEAAMNAEGQLIGLREDQEVLLDMMNPEGIFIWKIRIQKIFCKLKS